jgi:hypothetical protein
MRRRPAAFLAVAAVAVAAVLAAPRLIPWAPRHGNGDRPWEEGATFADDVLPMTFPVAAIVPTRNFPSEELVGSGLPVPFKRRGPVIDGEIGPDDKARPSTWPSITTATRAA